MRDNQWLLFRMEAVWRNHFKEVPQLNPVKISFGRSAMYRFGSIRMNLDSGVTKIIINGKFKAETVPEGVVDHTIAHELVHYAQGFSSPNPRLHRYPHRGGVINRELKERGLGQLIGSYKAWLRQYVKSLP